MKNNFKEIPIKSNKVNNKPIFAVLVVIAVLLAAAIGLSFSSLILPIPTTPSDSEYAGASFGGITYAESGVGSCTSTFAYSLTDPRSGLDGTVTVGCDCEYGSGACGVGTSGCRQSTCSGTCNLWYAFYSVPPSWPKVGYLSGTKYILGSNEKAKVSADKHTMTILNTLYGTVKGLICSCNLGDDCSWQSGDCMPGSSCQGGCYVKSTTLQN